MKTDSKPPCLLTVTDVAELLQVSQRTVRRRIESGDLKAHRLGRLVRISEEDLSLMIMRSRDEN